MKFIDLFAGLGGFHIGLKSINAECVFPCEIDKNLRNLYEENFGIECQGDITQIDEKKIPPHDILCAGFPCQPFSKAGKQKGLSDVGRGDLIYKIIDILSHHQPQYFILENVPNFKTHNEGKTWRRVEEQLKNCGYFIQDLISSPHDFGIPHKRERIFIIGSKKSISLPFFSKTSEQDINEFLEPNNQTDKKLSDKQLKCLKLWQKFISVLPKKQPLPKFPIWAMEFGATYPLNSKCPYYMSVQELAKYKGAFGESLKDFSKEQQLLKLPSYAIYQQKEFPKWKINYIQKNRNFWNENKKIIEPLLLQIKTNINSWQKLEWNAGDDQRDIFKYVLQFRSSGIRVKSRCSVSSLVLTGTQTPVIAWEKRYLNLREAQKLQGFEDINIALESESQSFRALGNAVNTKVVHEIVKKIFPKEVIVAGALKKQSITIPIVNYNQHRI